MITYPKGVTVKRLTGQERKHRIIEAAMCLFARRGFEGTTTRDIARASGVSEALLYKFFPNKNALYFSIIDYKFKQVSGRPSMSKLQGESDRDFFMRIATSYVDRIEKDDTFMRILLFSTLEGHRLAEMFFSTVVAGNTRILAQTIEEGIRGGRFRKMDPVHTARMFMGMLNNYLHQKKIFNIRKPPLPGKRKAIRDMIDVFLNGIEKNRT